MKKLTAMFLSAVVVLGLTSCSSTGRTSSGAASSNTATEAQTTEAQTTETQTTEAQTTEAQTTETQTTEAQTTEAQTTDTVVEETAEPETGKTLVVYYSASGNTARVAEDIAEAAGADLFEIVPTEVYTSADLNWTDSSSRVSREHDDESLRDVPLTTTEVPDWESYDTVFIGYPIWWGIAAWPVDGFVKANDFSGKTVIPFATSSSSGLGQSGTLLAEMAGTGDWQEGQRFSSGVSTSDVQSWVNGLNLN